MTASRPGKSERFSIRLATPEEEFVRLEAQRLRRSRSFIVESYAADAIRMRRYPGIAFRARIIDGAHGFSAQVSTCGRSLRSLRTFESEPKIAAECGLTPGQIRIARAYAEEFSSEIEEQLALGRRSEDELHARYPFIQTFEQATTSAGA
jgi:hypothetical protein